MQICRLRDLSTNLPKIGQTPTEQALTLAVDGELDGKTVADASGKVEGAGTYRGNNQRNLGPKTPESSFKVSHQPFTRQHHRAYQMSAVCVRIYRPQDSE